MSKVRGRTSLSKAVAAEAGQSGQQPPKGFVKMPKSRHGGYVSPDGKRHWYPSQSHAKRAHRSHAVDEENAMELARHYDSEAEEAEQDGDNQRAVALRKKADEHRAKAKAARGSRQGAHGHMTERKGEPLQERARKLVKFKQRMKFAEELHNRGLSPLKDPQKVHDVFDAMEGGKTMEQVLKMIDDGKIGKSLAAVVAALQKADDISSTPMRKARPHKYISRKPRPGGGWEYTYQESDRSKLKGSKDARRQASFHRDQADHHDAHAEDKSKSKNERRRHADAANAHRTAATSLEDVHDGGDGAFRGTTSRKRGDHNRAVKRAIEFSDDAHSYSEKMSSKRSAKPKAAPKSASDRLPSVDNTPDAHRPDLDVEKYKPSKTAADAKKISPAQRRKIRPLRQKLEYLAGMGPGGTSANPMAYVKELGVDRAEAMDRAIRHVAALRAASAKQGKKGLSLAKKLRSGTVGDMKKVVHIRKQAERLEAIANGLQKEISGVMKIARQIRKENAAKKSHGGLANVITKAAGHKYISKKPDGKGGWVYKYKHPKTGRKVHDTKGYMAAHDEAAAGVRTSVNAARMAGVLDPSGRVRKLHDKAATAFAQAQTAARHLRMADQAIMEVHGKRLHQAMQDGLKAGTKLSNHAFAQQAKLAGKLGREDMEKQIAKMLLPGQRKGSGKKMKVFFTGKLAETVGRDNYSSALIGDLSDKEISAIHHMFFQGSSPAQKSHSPASMFKAAQVAKAL